MEFLNQLYKCKSFQNKQLESFFVKHKKSVGIVSAKAVGQIQSMNTLLTKSFPKKVSGTAAKKSSRARHTPYFWWMTIFRARELHAAQL